VIDDARIELMRSWPHSGFQVHAVAPVAPVAPGDNKALESILEYIERPPVSLKKLRYLDSGMVVYEGKFHPGLGRDHQVVTGVEFLAMLVPHIQLRYESRARCYGAISTTLRRRFGWVAGRKTDGSEDVREDVRDDPACGTQRTPVEDDDPPDSPFKKACRGNWARLIRKVWIDDPEECTQCGERMEIVAVVVSPLQDDVIRKTLKRRGEWNPPWLGRDPPSPLSGDRAEAMDAPERTVEIEIDPDTIWED